MTIEQLASICHEANRALCAAGDDYSQLPWGECPEWQMESAKLGVELHLRARSEGREVADSESHDSWLAQKAADGWVYGDVKDAGKKEHPCMVPYDELPEFQKAKDALFGAVCRSLLHLVD